MRLDLNFFQHSTPGSFPEGLKEMFSFYRSGADGWIDGCRAAFALHSPHMRGGWRDRGRKLKEGENGYEEGRRNQHS